MCQIITFTVPGYMVDFLPQFSILHLGENISRHKIINNGYYILGGYQKAIRKIVF